MLDEFREMAEIEIQKAQEKADELETKKRMSPQEKADQ